MKSNKRVLPNKRALFSQRHPGLWSGDMEQLAVYSYLVYRGRRRPNPPSRRRSLAACDWIARP